jgi:hypothetical protein
VIRNFDKLFQRLEHVDKKISQFLETVKAQVANSHAIVNPKVDASHKKAEFILSIPNPPSMEVLGLEFGEILHHARSILDNAVVNFALHSLPGIDHEKLKNLQFIICTTDAEWNKSKNRLSVFPEKTINEIRRMQPFNGFGNYVDGSDNLFTILRDLDNTDKHYLQMIPDVNQIEANFNFTIQFEDEKAAINAGAPRTTVLNPEFKDGVKLFEIEVDSPMKSIGGNYGVKAELVFEHGGRRHNATSVVTQLCYATKVIIDSFQVLDDPDCPSFLVLKRA